MARANLKLRRFARHTVFRIGRTSPTKKSLCFYLLLDCCRSMSVSQLVEESMAKVQSVMLEVSVKASLLTGKRYRVSGILPNGGYFLWTRLLCYLRKALKDRLSGGKYAEWRRVGPPNNSLFCWELVTVA